MGEQVLANTHPAHSEFLQTAPEKLTESALRQNHIPTIIALHFIFLNLKCKSSRLAIDLYIL